MYARSPPSNHCQNIIQLKTSKCDMVNTSISISKSLCIHWLCYAMLYGPMLIISHHRSNSVEFNHRTSIKHANVFIRFVFFSSLLFSLYHYNRVVVHSWDRLISHDWIWPSVDKHRLCLCMDIGGSPKKSRRKHDIHKRETERNNLVRVLIFGLCSYDVNVFLTP